MSSLERGTERHVRAVAAPTQMPVLALARLRRHKTVASECVPVRAFLWWSDHPLAVDAEHRVPDVVHDAFCTVVG